MVDVAETPKKWMVDDAGTLLNTEERKYYDYPDEIVPVLNQYEHARLLDREVITGLRRKVKNYEKVYNTQLEVIQELKDENQELKLKDCECNSMHWKGVERAYEKILKRLYERNITLERQNQVLIDRLMEYEEREHEGNKKM